jgi:hypothetical protein
MAHAFNSDVADQINAKLDTISTNTANTAANTAATKNAVDQTNARLTALDGHLQAGLANVSQGLFFLSELTKVEIALADQNRKQNDTIICLLENSNELLCDITRKLTRQLELTEGVLKAVERVAAIEERVHASEAADYDRLTKLRHQIETCCPPPERPLEPCPEPCPKSDYVPPAPKGGDWKPLETPRNIG